MNCKTRTKDKKFHWSWYFPQVKNTSLLKSHMGSEYRICGNFVTRIFFTLSLSYLRVYACEPRENAWGMET